MGCPGRTTKKTLTTMIKKLFELILSILLIPVWLRWRAHERTVLGRCTGIEGREEDRVTAETADQ